MIPFLEGKLWQAATLGAAAIAIGLAGATAVQTARLADARGDLGRAQLQQRATDQALWTASGNVSALKAGLAAQATAVAALKAESDRRVAAAEGVAQAARKSTLAAEIASARIKAVAPIGVDVCARVLAVDETFLEAMR